MAKSLSRRRIRNVFGVPPGAVPRERAAPARPKLVDPFDIDTVHRRPQEAPATRKRRKK